MAGYCTTCDDRCYLLCEEDLFGGVTPLSQRIAKKKRQAMMWEAQSLYAEDLLGDCFEAICTAINNSNLDPEAEGYAAIPSDWKYAPLMNNYIRPLLVKATTLLYIHNYGFEDLDIQLQAREEREEFVERLEGYVNSLQQRLETELIENGDTYECPCEAKEEAETPSYDSGTWLASTKYPNFMQVESSTSGCEPEDATTDSDC